jgi:hypothetical protein
VIRLGALAPIFRLFPHLLQKHSTDNCLSVECFFFDLRRSVQGLIIVPPMMWYFEI